MSLPIILITGATAGIGFEAAKHYLSEGWQVIFTGRNSDKIATTQELLAQYAQSPEQVHGVLCDNGDANQFTVLLADLQARAIKLDALVLNAGVFYPKAFSQTGIDDIATTMQINFIGPAMLMQTLLPVLNNPCSVVYVSSIAVQRAFVSASVYAASKAAFEALANTVNIELAEQGVRVNFLRPGVTLTEIQTKAGMSEEQIALLNTSLEATPLGRMLKPQELVSSLAYLTSPAAAALRGAHITVDGGFCL